jgi:DNA-binding Lrp family transcriptional regulator
MAELDRTDIAILEILQEDARTPIKEIAASVGLSNSSTHARLNVMREGGVLGPSRAEVMPTALGVRIEAVLMVELSKHVRCEVDSFLDAVAEVPEVRSAFLVTGRHDVLIHVVARDMKHLKDLALDSITSRPGVVRVETAIVYETRMRHVLPDLRN